VNAELAMGPILAAIDGSDGAKRAVQAAARVAGKLNMDLWILYPMYAGVALRITSPQPIAVRPASATRAAAARAPIGDFLHWRKSRLEGAVLLVDGRCYRSWIVKV
jgi:hypothetical protein